MSIETGGQLLNPRVATVCAMVLAGGGCFQEGPQCYEEPRGAFAPHPATEEPVFDEPSWTIDQRPWGTAISTVVVLPWDYDQRAYYPIEQGDEAVFRMRFALGPSVHATNEVRVSCFVEGRPVDIDVGGPMAASSTVVLHAGTGVTDITLAPEQLQPGLNQVNAFATYRVDGGWELGTVYPFTIANGSVAPQRYDETPLETSDAPRGAPSRTITDPVTGQPVESVWTRRDDVNVTVILRPSVGDAYCEGGFDRSAIVALRDGIPTPIEGFDRIVTTLREGEQRQLRYRLQLWSDEGEHSYVALRLPGLGRATRTDFGGPSGATDWRTQRLVQLGWNGAL